MQNTPNQELLAFLEIMNDAKLPISEDYMSKPVSDHIWRACLILIIFKCDTTTSAEKDVFDKAIILLLMIGVKYTDDSLAEYTILGEKFESYWNDFDSKSRQGNLAKLAFICERYLTTIENEIASPYLKRILTIMQNSFEIPKELNQFCENLKVLQKNEMLKYKLLEFDQEEQVVKTHPSYQNLSDTAKIILFISATGQKLSETIRYKGQTYWKEYNLEYENVPSHCYLVALVYIFFFKDNIDANMLNLILLHDIEEAPMGDWEPLAPDGHANCPIRRQEKDDKELELAIELFKTLPKVQNDQLLTIWLTGNDDQSAKAICKACDSTEALSTVWFMLKGRMTSEHLSESVKYSEKRVKSASPEIKEFIGWLIETFRDNHSLPNA